MDNQFSVGAVLGSGFRIWGKNIIPFVLLTTVIYAPLLIWGVLTVQGEPELFTYIEQLDRFTKASSIIIPLSNLIVSSALTYGVVMELQGSHASIGSCIGTGLARFLPVLGVAILTVLVVGLGFLALIIPGIILFCMFYVATQVAVLERRGIMGALQRSRELTAGRKGAIFALLLLLGIGNFVLSLILESVVLDPSSLTEENVYSAVRRYMYIDLARAIIVGSLGAVMSAVAYFYLRTEKEGTTADELARVFD